MTDILLYIGLTMSMAIVVFLGAFASRMQATTLFVGKKIAPDGLDADAPRGFQDAITPKMQNHFNVILPVAYILILILGTLKIWYLGAALLILTFVLMFIVQQFYPNQLKIYLNIIIGSMNNKLADYVKSGDSMRADAAKEMLTKLQEFHIEIREQNIRVPTVSEARKTRLGR